MTRYFKKVFGGMAAAVALSFGAMVPAHATVTAALYAGTACGGAASATYTPGTAVPVSLCVTTTDPTEGLCTFTFVPISPSTPDLLQVTARTFIPSGWSQTNADPNVLPFTMPAAAQPGNDLGSGKAVFNSTPLPTGENLISTFSVVVPTGSSAPFYTFTLDTTPPALSTGSAGPDLKCISNPVFDDVVINLDTAPTFTLNAVVAPPTIACTANPTVQSTLATTQVIVTCNTTSTVSVALQGATCTAPDATGISTCTSTSPTSIPANPTATATGGDGTQVVSPTIVFSYTTPQLPLACTANPSNVPAGFTGSVVVTCTTTTGATVTLTGATCTVADATGTSVCTSTSPTSIPANPTANGSLGTATATAPVALTYAQLTLSCTANPSEVPVAFTGSVVVTCTTTTGATVILPGATCTTADATGTSVCTSTSSTSIPANPTANATLGAQTASAPVALRYDQAQTAVAAPALSTGMLALMALLMIGGFMVVQRRKAD